MSHDKNLGEKQVTRELWNNCIDGDIWQKRRIFVEIESIENVDSSKIKKISFKVEFKGQTILETENITITQSKDYIVKASGEIPVDEPSPRLMDDILANPLLFTVFDKTTSLNMPTEEDLLIDLKKESKKVGSRTSLSTKSAVRSTNATATFNVYGICNMDLGPLIKGQKILRENIVVETEKQSSGQRLITWPKLPRINVTVSVGEEELIPSQINKLNNIIGVTVESIYNAPGNVAEGTSFDAIFMIPCFGEKMETVTFSNGVLTNISDGECLKRWLTLSHIEGRGALTKYKIKPEACDIINSDDEEINLEKALCENCLRIQWNKWRSSIMVKTGSNFFFRKLSKYKFWPIEIAVTSRQSSQKIGKPEKRTKTASATTSQISQSYIAYLKLGSLLYPGVTRARVASKLYSYSQSDITEKCGSGFITPVATYSNHSKTKIEDKVNSSRKEQEATFNDDKDVSGSALCDENGNSVFIVVEVEVWKPYIPKREPEYFLERFNAYFSPKEKLFAKDMSTNVAMNNFIEIIEKMSFIINESYRNFNIEYGNNIPIDGIEVGFFRYLCSEELFQQMQTTLEDRILDLVGEKFGDFGENQEKLPQIFIYLVSEMRKITNSCMYKKKLVKSNEIQAEDLQLSVEEALEDGNYNLAKRYLLQKLSINKSNSDYWLDYALYSITLEDNEKAVECIREALLMNMEHQIGLLLYALIMAKFNEIHIAEIAFQVLLAKYPDFIEGWIVLHLFYSNIGYLEGAEFALQMASELECKKSCNESVDEKNTAERASLPYENEFEIDVKTIHNDPFAERKYGVASFSKGRSTTDPLSWTVRVVPNLSLFMKTAILLLRLRAFEFANMAISRELTSEKKGVSIQYMYYTAVIHYLQGQYDKAISHLQIAIEEFSENCFLWSLLGHCYFRLKIYDKCTECFEYLVDSYNRPDDIHLIYVRLGMCYMRKNEYKCAKKAFLSACKISPSSETWLGLGAACYNLTEFEEAEAALTEANFLDCMCPIIWAYLTLSNIHLQRYDIVDLCYTEAKKKNLKDQRLIHQIETLLEVHRLKISY